MKKIFNYHPSKWEALSFLLIPIFFGFLTALSFDNDIWFLINTGRTILNDGFITIDQFTIHNDLSLVIQQWIPDIIFYLSYSAIGKSGPYIITNILNIYLVFITYKLLMVITDNKRNLSVLITFIISIIISFSFVVARPQMFSLSILVTELYILESYTINKNKKILYLLPVLSLLMINCHASMWFLLFCFMIPFIIENIGINIGKLTSSKKDNKLLLCIMAIMFLCGFINPYGIEAITYVFTSYGVEVIDLFITEMMAPDVHTLRGLVSYAIVFGVYLLYLVFNNKKLHLRHFLLLIGTTYLAISSYRGIEFFAIGGIYSLGYYFKNKFFYVSEPNNKNGFYFYIFMIILLLISFGYINFNQELLIMDSSMKSGIDKLTSDNDVSNIRLYCNYGECNYAEYLGIKVYIDSRAEIFLKANNEKSDILEELYMLQNGHIYYKDFLDKYKFTHLLVKENDYLYHLLLHDSDYEIYYRGIESRKDYKINTASDIRYNYIIFKKVAK